MSSLMIGLIFLIFIIIIWIIFSDNEENKNIFLENLSTTKTNNDNMLNKREQFNNTFRPIKEKDENYDLTDKMKIILKMGCAISDSSFKNINPKRIIPLKIWQTWSTKNLPTNMQHCVNELKATNPEFEYNLFDDDDCLKFIEDNFNRDVVDAYNILIPGAYKADLWRYCVLYIHGGIYLDIKYRPMNDFKFISLTDREHFVFDIPGTPEYWASYNALMVCLPKNELLNKCINNICNNVKNRFYGKSPLDITGPTLLGKYVYPKNKIMNTRIDDLLSTELFLNKKVNGIIYHNVLILTDYPYYRQEQLKYGTIHYGILWKTRHVYDRIYKNIQL
jgi:mannosyltransferase OCH1-like enzyme